jgi:hypothetical protein
MRHLTHQTDARYRSRDSTVEQHRENVALSNGNTA